MNNRLSNLMTNSLILTKYHVKYSNSKDSMLTLMIKYNKFDDKNNKFLRGVYKNENVNHHHNQMNKGNNKLFGNKKNNIIKQQQNKIRQSHIHKEQNKSGQKLSQSLSSLYAKRLQIMSLKQYKQMVNQTKYLDQAIDVFKKYSNKILKTMDNINNENYVPLMYSYLLRAFTRILRRDNRAQKNIISSIIGNNYQKLRHINLSELSFISTSLSYEIDLFDYIAFFFQNQFAKGIIYQNNNGSNIIGKNNRPNDKQYVINRFLEEMLKRMESTQGQHNYAIRAEEEQNYSQNGKNQQEQNQQKRYFSYLLTCCRCSQVINSAYYKDFLMLLSKQLQQQMEKSSNVNNNSNTTNITPHNIRSITKFLLRLSNLSYLQQQISVFTLLLQSISSFSFTSNIQPIDLHDIYINLRGITQNFEYFLCQQNKRLIREYLRVFQSCIENKLHEMNSLQIYHWVRYFKSTNEQQNMICRRIYQIIFNNINQYGETSMNPIFIFSMVSLLSVHQVMFLLSISSNWQIKFMRMYEKYFISQEQSNNMEYTYMFFLNILHKRLLKLSNIQRIMNDYYQNKLIIKYQKKLMIKELLAVKFSKISEKDLILKKLIDNLDFFITIEGERKIVKEFLIKLKQNDSEVCQKQIKDSNYQKTNKQQTKSSNFINELNILNNKKYYKLLFSYLSLTNNQHKTPQLMSSILNYLSIHQPSKLRSTLFSFISVQLSQQYQYKFLNYIKSSSAILGLYLDLIILDQTSKTKIDCFHKFRRVKQFLLENGTEQQKFMFVKNKHSLILMLRSSCKFQVVSKNLFQDVFNKENIQKLSIKSDEIQHVLRRVLYQSKKCYFQVEQIIKFIDKVETVINVNKRSLQFNNFINNYKKQLNQLKQMKQMQKIEQLLTRQTNSSQQNSLSSQNLPQRCIKYCFILSLLKKYLQNFSQQKHPGKQANKLINTTLHYLFTKYFIQSIIPSYHYFELLKLLVSHQIQFSPIFESSSSSSSSQFIKILLAQYEFIDMKEVIEQVIKYSELIDKNIITQEIMLRILEDNQMRNNKKFIIDVVNRVKFDNQQERKRILKVTGLEF